MSMDPRLKIIVGALAKQKSDTADIPTLAEVRRYLVTCFPGADRYAAPFYSRMSAQHWLDRDRKQIRNWRHVAKAYASKAFLHVAGEE